MNAGARPRLLSPFALRGLTLKNRIVIAPMAMYSANEGCIDDFHLVHLGRFALGGAGLVIAEATAVVRDGRITTGCTGLWMDAQVEQLRRIPAFMHRFGTAAGIQLAHAGRKASTRRPWHGGATLDATDVALRREFPWQARSSTDEPFNAEDPAPAALSSAELDALVDDFAAATRRAHAAGFDLLELHCAHGYLLHSFLSPLANARTDQWGGDLAGRMRFPLRVVRAIRDQWPHDKPLLVRISAVDGRGVGWGLEDSVELCRALKAIGVDAIDCSSGGMKLAPGERLIAREQGFHVPLARRVRQEAGIATVAVGLIRDPRHAEAILQEESADLIALAREALFDPNWPAHAALTLEGPQSWSDWPAQFGYWLAHRERPRA